MSDNKEISKETKPEKVQKVVEDSGENASNSVSEERETAAPSGLAALVGDDLLESDEDDGSFNGEESESGEDSENNSEDDEDNEEDSSETEKRAKLNNLNDEQLFGLGASTGHNDNEEESDSDEEENENEEENEEESEENS